MWTEEVAMNRQFRLGTVLRARQAQEDAARSRVVNARQLAARAAAEAATEDARLRAHDMPDAGTGRSLVAAIVAARCMAADLAAANGLAEEAQERTTQRIGELVETARARRTMELLAEAHGVARRQFETAADQRMLDELAVTDRQRVNAREVG
jgi:flagellar biosynthesis chaperone FliJ